ncbi:MAG: hypothetical protein PVG24_15435 [Gammaproteobacteria bacterium]|jgi:uncharacterized membrane protein
MTRAVVLRLLTGSVFVLYPVLVYFGLSVLPPSFFGLLLALLILPRMIGIRSGQRLMVLPVTALFVYAIAAAVFGSTQALLYYPAVVNLVMCAVFAGSLFGDEPLLLRMVRARGMAMSQHAPAYLRGLTLVWAVFFALNSLVALWTTTRTLEIWTLYNGLLSYLLVAALMGIEWMYRRRYKRLRGVPDH